MELTLKDSEVRKAIGDYLDDHLFEFYPSRAIKDAGIPTRKDLIEQVMADPKFQKNFTKYLLTYIDGDIIADAVAESCPNLDAFERVEAVFNDQNTVDREKAQMVEDQMAIKKLTARGYKITK